MIAAAVAGDLAQVLDAFWRGSIGTTSALISGTLVRAVPLTIVGVGIAIAFRAGVFNIGGEGQLLVGYPPRQILRLAYDIAADLIVVGCRGLGRVKSVVFGSTSREVMAHADRPVLVVRDTKAGTATAA